MNYKIIQDEEKLKKFIDWLPDLKPNEMYYLSLFARKKYDTTGIVRKDKSQLKRFTSRKDMLITKIKQLECEVGAYVYDGMPVPQESLVLYITINPRDMRKAANLANKSLSDVLYNNSEGFNPHVMVMNNIQVAKGTEYFKEFDFDGIEWEDIKDEVSKAVNLDAVHVMKTRGGFHLIIEPQKVNVDNKKWYSNIKAIDGVDVTGDKFTPVMGCTQGEFCPYLIDIDSF